MGCRWSAHGRCLWLIAWAACSKAPGRSAVAPPPTQAQPSANKEGALPRLSDLPRLKLAWSSDAVNSGSGATGRPISGHGLVFVVRDQEVQALSLATGQPAWSSKIAAQRRLRLSLIGDHLVAASLDGRLVGFDAKTGKQLWAKTDDCMYPFGLSGQGKLAVGSCMKRPGPPGPAAKNPMAAAMRSAMPGREFRGVDLRTGKVLWAFTPPGRRPALQIAVDDKNWYYVQTDREPKPGEPADPASMLSATVRAHTLATGKEVWTSELQLSLSVAAIGGVVVVSGQNTVGLSPSDGKLLWTVPGNEAEMVIVMDAIDQSPPVHAGLIVTVSKNELRGLDPRTGRIAKRWPFPSPPSADDDMANRAQPTNLQADDERMLLLIKRGGEMVAGGSGHLLVWQGGTPKLFQSPPIGEGFSLAGDLVLVPAEGIKAYSLGETAASEATLDPPERVKEVLRRQAPTGFSFGSRETLGDLQGIPGLGDHLRRIAGDKSSTLRERAVTALRLLEEPPSVAVLTSILDEPLPARPPQECEGPAPFTRGGLPTAKQFEAMRTWQPSRQCQEAIGRYHSAQSLRGAAVRALARHETGDSAKRLASLLVPSFEADAWPGPDSRSEIYQLLARVGGPEAERALATLDEKRAPKAMGWNQLCSGASPDPAPRGFPGDDGICGVGAAAGNLRVAGAAPGVWIRPKDGRATAPALAFQDGLAVDVQEATEKEGKLIAKGQAAARSGGEGRPWSVEIETKTALADRDGDGISDKTEQFIGTDPANKDTDQDGKNDGEDASPMARPSRLPEQGEVLKEIVRYAFIEENTQRRLLYVHTRDKVQIDGVAAVVLHKDPPPESIREWEGPQVPGAGHVVIDEVAITREAATALVRKLEYYPHGGRLSSPTRLKLRRLGGTWRVTGSEDPDQKKKQ